MRSVFHAWGNSMLMLRSAGLTAHIARLSVLPLCLALGKEESVFMDPHGPTIAPRCTTAVIADKIKCIHLQKESKNLFLPTVSILPLCSQFAQPFQPLATWAEAWQAIPELSVWITTMVRWGHTLQFAQRPLRFCGVLTTTVCSENGQVLLAEVMNLLEKGAIEIIPPAQSESGFYRRYFLVPKKDGDLWPILDLRLLNYDLMKMSFRMITLKQIIPQICSGGWFMLLDLKDAYFHIQVAPPNHRRFLRFAFEGVTYQYKVLPFGLFLAPRTFTRCMDAALSPLWLMEICVLNYLDDWLILAQSQAVLTSHKTLLLSHLDCLGLRVNFAKSILSPSQRVSFLVTVIDSVQMTATVSAERATTI